MPPAVLASDIVVPDHLVADICRLVRQLDREQLVRRKHGTISMLHPGMPGGNDFNRAGTNYPGSMKEVLLRQARK